MAESQTKIIMSLQSNGTARSPDATSQVHDAEVLEYFDPNTDFIDTSLADVHTKYDVFVSHAGEQKRGVVSVLVDYLENWGLRVFVDYKMTVGDRATDEMRHAASHASLALFVLSEDFFSETKKWTFKELLIVKHRYTQNSTQVKILPFYYGLGPGHKGAQHLSAFAQELLTWVSETVGKEYFDGTSYTATLLTQVAKEAARMVNSDLVTYLTSGIEPFPKIYTLPTLLQARHEVVPFQGNSKFMDRFISWCISEDGPRIAMRIIEGGGGAGKTRTMMEVTKILRREHGIRSGFLPKGTDIDTFNRILTNCISRVTVIVLDYAETWSSLPEMLQALITHRQHMHSGMLRIVFVSRSTGEWSRTIMKHANRISDRMVDVMSVPTQDPKVAFIHAFYAFKKKLDELGSPTSTDLTTDDPMLKEALLSPRTIFFHMAALLCVKGDFGSSNLVNTLLEREEKYWDTYLRERRAAVPIWSINKYGMKFGEIVAAITLIGGTVTERASEMLIAELGHSRILEGSSEFLHSLYSTQDRYNAPLEPDLLGEELIYKMLIQRNEEDRVAYLDLILRNCDWDKVRNAIAVLHRVGERKAFSKNWILLLLQKQIALLGQKAQSDSLVQAMRAEALVMLCKEQQDVNQLDHALASIKEAVKLHRTLVQSNGNMFLPHLADSLATLRKVAESKGDLELALTSLEEAESHYKELAKERPQLFLPDLASVLSSRSSLERALGRPDEATAADLEAKRIGQQIGRAGPDVYCFIFGDLGEDISTSGWHEDSLEVVSENVNVNRQLSSDTRKDFNLALAASLSNLAIRQMNRGQIENALHSAEEALNIIQSLQGSVPKELLCYYLATALNNLGVAQLKAGNRESALYSMLEGSKTLKQMTSAPPDNTMEATARMKVKLAHAGNLNNLGIVQMDFDRSDAALASSQEAVRIYKELAMQEPDVFSINLATSLSNLGGIQSFLGKRSSAIASCREAVAIFERLSISVDDRHSGTFMLANAAALNNLGVRQADVGQIYNALATTEQAVMLYREALDENPNAVEAELAVCLGNLALRQHEIGNWDDALLCASESVTRMQKLTKLHRTIFDSQLARSELIQAEIRLSSQNEMVPPANVDRWGPSEYDVFFGHSGFEKLEVVSHITQQLTEKYNIRVFVDYISLQPGMPIATVIQNAAWSTPVGLFLISNDFLKQMWPRRELSIFLQRKNNKDPRVRLIPIFYRSSFNTDDFESLTEEERTLLQNVRQYSGFQHEGVEFESDLVDHVARSVADVVTSIRTEQPLPWTTRNNRFDVFLSFRGSETLGGDETDTIRKRLVTPLAVELSRTKSVFLDDQALMEQHATILDDIFQGIMSTQGGGVAVLLISRTYFESLWLLLELASFVELYKARQVRVLPFLLGTDVTPEWVISQPFVREVCPVLADLRMLTVPPGDADAMLSYIKGRIEGALNYDGIAGVSMEDSFSALKITIAYRLKGNVDALHKLAEALKQTTPGPGDTVLSVLRKTPKLSSQNIAPLREAIFKYFNTNEFRDLCDLVDRFEFKWHVQAASSGPVTDLGAVKARVDAWWVTNGRS